MTRSLSPKQQCNSGVSFHFHEITPAFIFRLSVKTYGIMSTITVLLERPQIVSLLYNILRKLGCSQSPLSKHINRMLNMVHNQQE